MSAAVRYNIAVIEQNGATKQRIQFIRNILHAKHAGLHTGMPAVPGKRRSTPKLNEMHQLTAEKH
jgi:hypothetical protein